MGFGHRRMDVEACGSGSSVDADDKVEVITDPLSIEQKVKKERSREKEKEKTKLRERHRRSITSNILAGLRRYGNYNLPVRADINDVIKALAREAGWTVEADGTTFRSKGHSAWMPSASGSTFSSGHYNYPQKVLMSDMSDGDIKPAEMIMTKDTFLSKPQSQYNVAGLDHSSGEYKADVNGKFWQEEQMKQFVGTTLSSRDFLGTPYIPVYVTLPLSIFRDRNQLLDPIGLRQNLIELKSSNVDGVMIECCWGLVENDSPHKYDWSGYVKVFQMVQEADLKLQVSMAFHECIESDSDIIIPLPSWILDVGRENPDIFFTDRQGRRNRQCLSWGVDRERVLKGRNALEVYYDFMRSFRQTFECFFENKTIVSVEIGLGARGELQYPSHCKTHGWIYPGIGEFQCFDKYTLKHLKSAAEARGCPEWGRAPLNTGHYNSGPQEAFFFCDGGEYNRFYGRFFLNWYSQMLIDHGDQVLSVANIVFEGTKLFIKISGVHWSYKTSSHAAELTAGFYNVANRDGYASILKMLAKQNSGLNFATFEPSQQENFFNAQLSPAGLQWQVLNGAWEAGISISSSNVRPCYDRDYYIRVLADAKPFDDPDGHHLASFTYSKLSQFLLERTNFEEFKHFVSCMHGFGLV
ncbi:hypothetical protein KP509_26G071100 [Ceratopteris richardii]|uniref:Beta-amylase n=2 Tax=Ceratopteris richardii TaxID=49495 RepID=A0A8T2RPI2_CERRI|nr:hypothetical protein KP509_26G071100 [Ceratopteris richardii]